MAELSAEELARNENELRQLVIDAIRAGEYDDLLFKIPLSGIDREVDDETRKRAKLLRLRSVRG